MAGKILTTWVVYCQVRLWKMSTIYVNVYEVKALWHIHKFMHFHN